MHLYSVINKFCIFSILLPMALMAAGCNVEKLDEDENNPAPLPIEFYFTVSDESGRNLLDQSQEDCFQAGDISLVYGGATFRPGEQKNSLTLILEKNLEGTVESVYFGQIDGTLNIEADPVTLNVGEYSFTVILTNSYNPATDITAQRHYFWHNQDWYGKDVIPFVVEDEKEFVPPENLIDIDSQFPD